MRGKAQPDGRLAVELIEKRQSIFIPLPSRNV